MNDNNLCTWYILPVILLNKNMFTDVNFINSYLTGDLSKIVVEVIDKELCEIDYKSHWRYLEELSINNREFLIFSIPPQQKNHVQLFLEGRYSEFEWFRKYLIQSGSGLAWNRWNSRQQRSITDPIILALDKPSIINGLFYEGDKSFHLPKELKSI